MSSSSPTGIWRRKLIDGKPGLGLVPGLLIAVGTCTLIIFLLWGVSSSMGPTERPKSNAEIDIKDLNHAAENFTQAKEEEREKSGLEQSDRSAPTPTRSERVEVATAGSVAELSDALTQVVTQPPARNDGGRQDLADESGLPVDGGTAAEGAPSDSLSRHFLVGSTGTGDAAEAERNNTNLVVYKRSMAQSDPPAVPDAKPQPTAPTSQAPHLAPGLRLPRGTVPFKVVTLDDVSSLEAGALIRLAVAEPVVFNGKVVLPVGTQLLGSASATITRDRAQITITAVSWPDGTESGIQGFLRDLDGQMGVRGYYFAEDLLAKFAVYGQAFTQAYLVNLTSQSSGVGQATGNLSGATYQDPLREQLARFIIDQVSQQAADLKERYKPFLLVPAGVEARVTLTAAFVPGGNTLTSATIATTQASPNPVKQ